MNKLENLFGDKTTAPTTIVENPFQSKYITHIYMSAYPDVFKEGKWEFHASVEFTNGSTKGEQRLEAENFAKLYEKVAEFCVNI